MQMNHRRTRKAKHQNITPLVARQKAEEHDKMTRKTVQTRQKLRSPAQGRDDESKNLSGFPPEKPFWIKACWNQSVDPNVTPLTEPLLVNEPLRKSGE